MKNKFFVNIVGERMFLFQLEQFNSSPFLFRRLQYDMSGFQFEVMNFFTRLYQARK